MDRRRFEIVQSLFNAALELPEPERAAYLDTACAGDAELRAEVDRLLALEAQGTAGRGLEGAVADAARSLGADPVPPDRMLGAYRLIRDIGAGGMGAVWLAERADEAYRAQVAVKLLRGGFAHPELERRFRAERQILADLRHPNIARLLDGGTAPDGTPYLVMEHVDGLPITDYAARAQLDLDARLALFRQVCDAVQHAHASLIVHRDIKPSNILVGEDGVPKLLDFGIAKPLAPGPGTETTVEFRLLTPSYASPEQLRGERITVATDVHALGGLLFELLTGIPAFPVADGDALDTQRRILEEDPPAPSRVLADARGEAAGMVRPRQLAGDLDNIVARALRKEPAERYGSVAELAADIDRYGNGEPVLARPAGAAYRVRKFVQRHRGGVLGTAAAVLLVIALSAYYVVTLQHERDIAERQREVAEREQAKAEQVSAFMVNLFQYVDPEASRGATVTAREVMEEAVRQLDTALVDQPDVRAHMLSNIADVYVNIGLDDHAGPVIEEVIRVLRARQRPPDYPLARAHYLKAKRSQAPEDWAAALAIADSAGPPAAAVRMIASAAVAQDLANAGDWERAQRMMQAVLAEAKTRSDEFPDAFAEAETSIARTLMNNGRYREALPLVEDAAARRTRMLGRDEPRTVMSVDLVSVALSNVGRYRESLELSREVLELRRKLRGDSTPGVAYSLAGLASLSVSLGNNVAADSFATEALAIARKLYGDRDHWIPGYALNYKGQALAGAGRLEEGERFVRAAAEMLERFFGANELVALLARGDLARILIDLGRLDEAERTARTIVTGADTASVPIPTQLALFRTILARVHLQRGDVAGADSLLALALPAFEADIGRQHEFVAELLVLQAEVALARGAPAAADPLVQEALATYLAITPDNRGWLGEARATAGAVGAALGRTAEARALLRQAVADLEASRGEGHPLTERARRRLQEVR